MVRITSGVVTRRRHNKILKKAKGYWMSRSTQFKKAKEATLHAGEYAFHGRKRRKRDFRSLWITRINAGLRELGMSYSTFIHASKEKEMTIDRKVLAQIAVEHPSVFKKIVEVVQ